MMSGNEESKPKSLNAIRVARYRKDKRRIDYSPGPEAAALIERVRQANPGRAIGGILDHLVRRAITGA